MWASVLRSRTTRLCRQILHLKPSVGGGGLKGATRLVFVAIFLRVISTEHAREDHIMTRAKDARVSRRDKDSNGNVKEVKRSEDESNESARRHTLIVEHDAPGGYINLVELIKSAQQTC